MLSVLIYELVLNGQQQGTPVSFKVRLRPPFLKKETGTFCLAYCQPHVGSFRICVDIRWSKISSVHEERGRRTADPRLTLFVSSLDTVIL